MALLDRGQPAVERRRRDALVPHRVGGDDRFHQRVEPLPVSPETGTSGTPCKLRQRRRQPVAQLPQRGLPVVHRIPFVGGDDQRPPLFGDQVGDGQILRSNGSGRRAPG